MDKQHYGLRQKVTEGEINQLLDYAEAGMEAVAADIVPGGGVVRGMAVTVQTGFTVTVASGTARDSAGARASIAANTALDLTPYKPSTSGNQKWVTLYAKRNRIQADPRTDGLGVTYYFQQTESVQLVVVQGVEAVSAVKPARTGTDGVVLCDVLLSQAASNLTSGDIDVGRREVYSPASSIAAAQVTYAKSAGYGGGIVQVQGALDDIDTRFVNHNASANPHTQYILNATRGAVNGVASLDGTGKVPTAQLPAANYILASEKAAASGVASLDGTGVLVQDARTVGGRSPGASVGNLAYYDSAGRVNNSALLLGWSASQSVLANGVAVRDSAGRVAGDITGNAASVGNRFPGNANGIATLDGLQQMDETQLPRTMTMTRMLAWSSF